MLSAKENCRVRRRQ